MQFFGRRVLRKRNSKFQIWLTPNMQQSLVDLPSVTSYNAGSNRDDGWTIATKSQSSPNVEKNVEDLWEFKVAFPFAYSSFPSEDFCVVNNPK